MARSTGLEVDRIVAQARVALPSKHNVLFLGCAALRMKEGNMDKESQFLLYFTNVKPIPLKLPSKQQSLIPGQPPTAMRTLVATSHPNRPNYKL